MEHLDLSSLFTTKSQAMDFAARLSHVSEQVFTTTFELEHVVTEQFGIQQKELIIKLMRQNNIKDTPSDVQSFLKKLQETILTLPVITLTLAFEPRDETLKAFSEWFLLTLKKQVLLSIELDMTLIAGARITYNGKYKEYAVRDTFLASMASQIQPQPTPKQQTPESLPHQTAQPNITAAPGT